MVKVRFVRACPISREMRELKFVFVSFITTSLILLLYLTEIEYS